MNPCLKYAKDVVEGREIAGRHVRAACQRHLDDRKRSDIYFDVKAAQKAYDFFRYFLKLSGGRFDGNPFVLEPVQCFIVGSIFGWKRRGTGRKADDVRRFTRVYIEMAKGNGKTPLAAGIALYGAIVDREPAAEVYIAASNGKQARICFEDVLAMVYAEPELHSRVEFVGKTPVKRLLCLDGTSSKPSIIEPVSRNFGKQGSGFRPHFVIFDELHEHPSAEAVETLEAGFKWRPQPLSVKITNSGWDKRTICWQEHQHAIRVVHGEVKDDKEFAFVCSIDDGDDPFSEKLTRAEKRAIYKKANPLLDVTMMEADIDEPLERARSIPARRNSVLRLNFCVWTNAENAWFTREKWESIETREDLWEMHRGHRCWTSVDLSSTNDLTTFAFIWESLLGPTEDGRPRFDAAVHSFTPRDTLEERSRIDQAPYGLWVEEGFITATDGPKIALEVVAAWYFQTVRRYGYLVELLGYDNYLWRNFEPHLQNAFGGEPPPVVEHPQGTNHRASTPLWMPGSIEVTEQLVGESRLLVAYCPVLRQAIEGAVFYRTSAELRRFLKSHSTRRIDPAVALAMGLGVATMPPPDPPPKNPWEDPEFDLNKLIES